MELKEKINSEKQNYEKEEIREKYKAMDSLVRAEFQRKDEALKGLQEIMENQLILIRNSLKQEETSRYHNETVLKEDILRFQENIRRVQKNYFFTFF